MSRPIYGVRNTLTGKYHKKDRVAVPFTDKMDAKEARRKLNGELKETSTNTEGTEVTTFKEDFDKGWVVTYLVKPPRS